MLPGQGCVSIGVRKEPYPPKSPLKNSLHHETTNQIQCQINHINNTLEIFTLSKHRRFNGSLDS